MKKMIFNLACLYLLVSCMNMADEHDVVNVASHANLMVIDTTSVVKSDLQNLWLSLFVKIG